MKNYNQGSGGEAETRKTLPKRGEAAKPGLELRF